jgi:LDH2 family malate/lactate/ureidoglycolate dehydrogenase
VTTAERVEEAVELGVEDLRTFGREVYVRVGVPAGDAAVVVEAQLDADLRGVDTHGLGGRRLRRGGADAQHRHARWKTGAGGLNQRSAM